MSSRLHVLSISDSADTRLRCENLCKDFNYSFFAQNISSSVVGVPFDQVQFIVTDPAAPIEEIRAKFKDSFIFVVVSEKETQENIQKIKRRGASQCMRLSDFLAKSRLEYIASQVIRAAYVPVKVNEFPQGSTLDFTLYHLMPLNQKFLSIAPRGTQLDGARMQKLGAIGEVFVRRDEIERYRLYVEAHPDNTAQGLKSKCRAQYLSLSHAHSQLMLMMTDAEEAATDSEAKWLMSRCDIIGQELLRTLSAIGEAWDVVNNSSIGEMGSVERAPTIATYTGLLSFMTSIGNPQDMLMAALLMDVGMLELDPVLIKKLRQEGNVAQLSPEQLSRYQQHPLISLDFCERKKVPLNEKVKETIRNSHEKISGLGFPTGKRDRIPQEAMLLQFCEMIDFAAMVKMGQAKKPIKEVRLKILDDLFHDQKTVSTDFLHKLKPIL